MSDRKEQDEWLRKNFEITGEYAVMEPTLTKIGLWELNMNTCKEAPLMMISSGTEPGKGFTIRTGYEMSASQTVSLLEGILNGIKMGLVKISTT